MRVVCVAGARPNFMKIAPILKALDSIGLATDLVHTGQHYDAAMSDVFFEDLGMRAPDHHLGVGSGTHAEQTARVMVEFETLLDKLEADVVLTVGDVTSTLACCITGAKAGVLVAHVEAGLRSRDWSMPEEVNRVVADRVSDYLLAPSSDAVENLEAEGYRNDQIHLVGNVMVDSLLANVDRARAGDVLERVGVTAGEYGLVTLHRPANVDDPAMLADLLGALDQIAERLPLVFPIHPRTQARIEAAGIKTNLRLVDPAGYLDFIALEADAAIVLTDSGGVQEETTVLGVPCLTLRENTERPITITEGTNQLIGRDPARIVAAATEVLTYGVTARRPDLWDGKAAERIAEVIANGGTAADRARPTHQRR